MKTLLTLRKSKILNQVMMTMMEKVMIVSLRVVALMSMTRT